jgi:hypothetical protein
MYSGITPIRLDYITLMFGITGKNGQIDHPFPVQIDHQFRSKLTTKKLQLFLSR